MFAFVHYEAIIVYERDIPVVAACFSISMDADEREIDSRKEKKEFSFLGRIHVSN